MRVIAHAPVAHHNIGAAFDNRLDQGGDIGAFILAIGIRVDDNIRAFGQRPFYPAAKSGGKAAIAPVDHDMRHAPLACDLRGAIGGAIIDHKNFDCIHARDPARQRGQRGGQGLCFVEAGYLDNQLGHLFPYAGPAWEVRHRASLSMTL